MTGKLVGDASKKGFKSVSSFLFKRKHANGVFISWVSFSTI